MPTSSGCACAKLSQALVSPGNFHLFCLRGCCFLFRVSNCAWEFSAPVFGKSNYMDMMAL